VPALPFFLAKVSNLYHREIIGLGLLVEQAREERSIGKESLPYRLQGVYLLSRLPNSPW
jgi:hypothetical protein